MAEEPSSSSTIPATVITACKDGDEAVLIDYLASLANLEHINDHAEDSYTLLHLAAEAGHHRLVEALIANGASASAVDNDGQTPLHLAAGAGHLDAVKSLTKGDCPELLVEDKYQMTPFHLACESGYHGMVQYLMSMFKIEKRMRRGSALFLAQKNNHEQVVAILERMSEHQEQSPDVEIGAVPATGPPDASSAAPPPAPVKESKSRACILL